MVLALNSTVPSEVGKGPYVESCDDSVMYLTLLKYLQHGGSFNPRVLYSSLFDVIFHSASCHFPCIAFRHQARHIHVLESMDHDFCLTNRRKTLLISWREPSSVLISYRLVVSPGSNELCVNGTRSIIHLLVYLASKLFLFTGYKYLKSYEDLTQRSVASLFIPFSPTSKLYFYIAFKSRKYLG